MPLANTATHYGLISKALHWLLAASVFFLIWLGWWMVGLGYYDAYAISSLSLHKALGMLLGFLVLFKLLWQIFSPKPSLTSSLNLSHIRLEKLSSRITHSGLLLSIIILPISGYLISSSEGASIAIFSWFEFPALLSINDASRDFAIRLHFYAAYFTLILALIHAAAALKHHYIDRDDTLKRMLP